MTRRAFLKKYTTWFVAALLPVALIVYTVYHVFGSSGDRLMTAAARRITDYRIESGQGYLFRDEQVLATERSGLIQTLAESGSKVNSGGELASVYHEHDGSQLQEKQARLELLNRMIAVLQASKLSAGVTLAKAEEYRAETDRLYRELREAIVSGGRWQGMETLEDSMLIMLNRYQLLTDPEKSYSELLDGLSDERAELLQGDRTLLLNQEASGYFYDREYVDGYETLFTLQEAESLTPERFQELCQAEPQMSEGHAVGKLVYGYRWSLAVALGTDACSFLKEGEGYSFSFPENGGKVLELTCARLSLSADGSGVAVFFSEEIPSDFLYLRSQPVEITVGSTTGYYVPEAAMREVNGVEGVYIFEIGTVYFRRVEVLYRGDGYCIVAEQGDRGGDYLALNDIMVTSGEVLYDGRVYE